MHELTNPHDLLCRRAFLGRAFHRRGFGRAALRPGPHQRLQAAEQHIGRARSRQDMVERLALLGGGDAGVFGADQHVEAVLDALAGELEADARRSAGHDAGEVGARGAKRHGETLSPG